MFNVQRFCIPHVEGAIRLFHRHLESIISSTDERHGPLPVPILSEVRQTMNCIGNSIALQGHFQVPLG